ncbi:MAG: tetratricopeptide repeat protein [Candidatus Hydrogenedentes bacterium]|nr:tetratricopeptide repeat protein [Candidatus Hydrogenedentota bacterium]
MAFGGDNAESYYDDGVTASMKGDLKRAARCFELAVKKDPSFIVAYHQLGKCYLRMGATKRAVSLLQRVVNHMPDKAPFRIDLGQAYLVAGEYERAREQFEWLLAVGSSRTRAHLGLAQVYFAMGRFDEAVHHARQAVDLGGINFAALFILGKAGMVSQDSSVALEALDRADKLIEKSLELNPDQVEGYYLRGEVAYARRQYSSALEHYRAADDRAKKDAYYSAFGENFRLVDILAKMGLCYRQLDRIDRAKELGTEILALDPEHKIGKALSAL